MTPPDLNTILGQPDWYALHEVAEGSRDADIYVGGGRVVDVLGGRIATDAGIAISGTRIAYVGPADNMIGPGTQVIDAAGTIIVPGFIDAHAHAELVANPVALSEMAAITGTTTLLTETSDTCAAMGLESLAHLFKLAETLPVRWFFSLPSTYPPYPGLEGPDMFPLDHLQAWLGRPRSLALAEVTSWPRVAEGDPELLAKMAAARNAGKRVEGHTSGASAQRLAMLAAAGTTSCHESVKPQEVRDKLRLGWFVMLRHGSLRSDLAALVEVIDDPYVDTRQLGLTPDGIMPDDMLKRGYMDGVVRDAIALGVPPIQAVRMATLNPATYLNLQDHLGSVTCGRLADLVFLPDLWEVRPSRVMVGGAVVAEDGQFRGTNVQLPDGYRNTPAWQGWGVPAEAGAFLVAAAGGDTDGTETIPVIHYINGNITRRQDRDFPVRNGLVELPDDSDVMRASIPALDRRRFMTGFVSGFGCQLGGFVSTMPFGPSRPLVIGSRIADMAAAWARAGVLGGGLIYVEGGEVVAEVPLPIGGLQSEHRVPQLARQLETMHRAIEQRGFQLSNVLVTTRFLPFTGLPFIRLTPAGVVDVKSREVVYRGLAP